MRVAVWKRGYPAIYEDPEEMLGVGKDVNVKEVMITEYALAGVSALAGRRL